MDEQNANALLEAISENTPMRSAWCSVAASRCTITTSPWNNPKWSSGTDHKHKGNRPAPGGSARQAGPVFVARSPLFCTAGLSRLLAGNAAVFSGARRISCPACHLACAAKHARIRRGMEITTVRACAYGADAQDKTSQLLLTWYNQPYRAQSLAAGQEWYACGRMDRSRGVRLVNPPYMHSCQALYRSIRWCKDFPRGFAGCGCGSACRSGRENRGNPAGCVACAV